MKVAQVTYRLYNHVLRSLGVRGASSQRKGIVQMYTEVLILQLLHGAPQHALLLREVSP